VKKRESKKPFAWTNDSELDKLTALNKKLNAGATLESLRNEFEKLEQSVSEKEKLWLSAKSDLKSFYELKEKLQIIFEGKTSQVFTRQQAEQALKQYPTIDKNNYRNVGILIGREKENVEKAEAVLMPEREKLKEVAETFSMAEKIAGGTYVQSLVSEERERRESKFVPNGLKQS